MLKHVAIAGLIGIVLSFTFGCRYNATTPEFPAEVNVPKNFSASKKFYISQIKISNQGTGGEFLQLNEKGSRKIIDTLLKYQSAIFTSDRNAPRHIILEFEEKTDHSWLSWETTLAMFSLTILSPAYGYDRWEYNFILKYDDIEKHGNFVLVSHKVEGFSPFALLATLGSYKLGSYIEGALDSEFLANFLANMALDVDREMETKKSQRTPLDIENITAPNSFL